MCGASEQASAMIKNLLLFVLVVGSLKSVNAQCFNPDGSGISDPAYQPCNQVDGTISQCCGTNHTGGKVAPDKCLPNGLCQNTGDLVYWRNGCTDRTFKSPFCLNICLDEDGGDSTENAPVISCPGGTWCCGSSVTDCCATSSLRFSLAATIGISSSTSSSARTSSTTSRASSQTTTSNPSSSSPTSAPTDSQTPNNGDTDGGGISSSAKIGIGVGVPVGFLLFAGIIGFFMYLRRRDFKRFQQLTQNNGNGGANGVMEGEDTLGAARERSRWTRRFEMDGRSKPVELQADKKPRFELPS